MSKPPNVAVDALIQAQEGAWRERDLLDDPAASNRSSARLGEYLDTGSFSLPGETGNRRRRR